MEERSIGCKALLLRAASLDKEHGLLVVSKILLFPWDEE